MILLSLENILSESSSSRLLAWKTCRLLWTGRPLHLIAAHNPSPDLPEILLRNDIASQTKRIPLKHTWLLPSTSYPRARDITCRATKPSAQLVYVHYTYNNDNKK